MGLRKSRLHSTCRKPKGYRKIRIVSSCHKSKLRRRRSKQTCNSSLRRLQAQVLASSAGLEQLTASVSSIITFVNQTRNDVNVLQNEFTAFSATNQDIREQLIARIGTTINIETSAGSVTGLLIAVGDDYVEILETSGATAIVRIAKINSFS